ncbi:MAG: type III restriction endonuclease subunit R [Armatimonadota bacterium]|nr:MAG: type III restriction endonuclease subunit R [Armatimonadota bacterium]
MAFEVTEQNIEALQPLFRPWEEPTQHRVPNPVRGEPALVQPGRRPSKVPTVRAIRAQVDAWRRGGYAGVSDTTRRLLQHWFETEHLVTDKDGETVNFRYHWAQREAIETFIYLYEVRGVCNLAQLLTEFSDGEVDDLVLGIPPDQDRWAKYCAKVATGAGKTKIMSLAIAWSYFHSLYEPRSDLARHFVIIAPNLTVYERLKDDFENCAIFYQDPLIPEEWLHDFQVQVVLQDEPGGTTTTGTVYLTNIHRLYPRENQKTAKGEDFAERLFGPPVVRGRALDTGEGLRERITAHPRLMVLNDEAHHLHDPELAWNRAIEALHDQSLSRGNAGVCLQLDFTATPKHNDGTYFRHIVCDFPLGEAVDAGIVKVPLIGQSEQLQVQGDKHTPAHERYRMHLKLAYERYEKTYEELGRVRKPILFVMTEDTKSADEIAHYLDSEEFPLLKGHVLNIHTRLKGKIVTVKRGGREVKEFVEDESKMKPDDLRELRRLSRELDSKDSPYRCVVSVLMLREGWDVRNVTTIVPLRPYVAKSGILPEQTLGRGLRRMFPPGDQPETVVVIEHPAFIELYEAELAQEGLDIAVLPAREVFKQTVTIYVDFEHKPVESLEIEIPLVSEAIQTTAKLEGLEYEQVVRSFRERFQKLPIGTRRNETIAYEERHLFTDEVVASMQLDAGLLQKGWSAPAYFAQMLARGCHVPNAHATLAPLIERFICEELFERPVDLYGGEVDHRLRDADVMEHIRAVFAPLIREHTMTHHERKRISKGQRLSTWKPYQATSTAERPAIPADRTMFNLVPCANELEQAFADFVDKMAGDVVAFAKNAGPQKLMIDYLRPDGARAFYVPDFIVRTAEGTYYLVELKGRVDELVPLKARAAVEWCKAASSEQAQWKYLYVPYLLFQSSAFATMEHLARACAPKLSELLREGETKQRQLHLEEATVAEQQEEAVRTILKDAGVSTLPEDILQAVRQAAILLDHAVKTSLQDFAHAFQPLLRPLDDLAIRILEKRLKPFIPSSANQVKAFFNPYPQSVHEKDQLLLQRYQKYLSDNLVYGRSLQRLGTLLFCLDYAQNWSYPLEGIWKAVREAFSDRVFAELYRVLEEVNRFRNTRVAHVEQPLKDASEARQALCQWVKCLDMMAQIASVE